MQDQLNNLAALLSGGAAAMNQIGVWRFLFLMVTSLAASLAASYLYLHFYTPRTTGSEVHRAFPLLGISITAIFICIQFSLPLSLGLLGALSIVRFRTPIKEPEEIGFIMLVIASSIAVATSKLNFVAIIFVIAVAALVVQTAGRRFVRQRVGGTIVVTVPNGGSLDGSGVAALLKEHLSGARLESISQSDGHTVYSYYFRSVSPQALLALQQDLHSSAGGSTFNVLLNRPVLL
ncbi:MAG TPA: DUF4956 domain-containing protein [Vicinamibacterales bacterium]|nr:DUF4956 domain-containing protein [Vicinamibacterales bacterium]